MQNNRYNSFNQIHKGLRVLLYDTATRLQQTDLSDYDTGNPVIDQVEEVLYLFESHAHGEDHFFNEPLEARDSEVASLFVKEHEEDHRLSQVINDLITHWKQQTTPEGRRTSGRNLFYAFNEFIAFNLYHMNKEEIQLNASLWKYYTDVEIKQIEQTLVQQIPPQKMALYAKWMIKGINNVELAHWMHEVHMFAPKEVYQLLDITASEHLTEERYKKVHAIVDERRSSTKVFG